MGKHVVEAEELQAYLDRELGSARQAEVERHLGDCHDCQAVVADLKRVSEALLRWQVEPAPASLRPPAIEAARRWAWGRLALAFGGTAVVALLVVSLTIPNLLKSRSAGRVEEARRQTATAAEPPAAPANDRLAAPAPPPASSPFKIKARESAAGRPDFESKDAPLEQAPAGEVGGLLGGIRSTTEEAAPRAGTLALKSATPARMIAYRVTMTVEVKEFQLAKEKLLRLVEASGGYVAEASTAETPNQPRRADLVVRVPVTELPAVLEEMRGLGRVLNEQLTSEELTEQIVDLGARLRNARATEQRLIAVLNERTGKVRDILEVEREIARTRQEIERMEAHRQSLLHRVELATIHATLVEEFKAQLEPAPVGTGTQLHNAFVEGYEGFVDTLLGFVFFFARYGLSLLFWSALLWLSWRAMRRAVRGWFTRTFTASA